MVVIKQKRLPGQDGRPTNPQLLKALRESKDLNLIPHQYYFPEVVLKNFIKVKKTVLKNKEAYIRSGGGNKMTSAVMIVDGKSGSGKSTIAAQMGLFFDPSMTMEKNYAWNMDRLMHLVENTYPGMVIIMDEAMVVNSRSANSDANIKLIIALSQIRSKGVFFIFCINSVHQLEKTIPLSRANFLVHVRRIGGLSGTPKYCVYDEDRMKQLIIKNSGKYSYAGVFPNIDWMTFSRYFPFDDSRYDKMKHKESLKNLMQKSKKSVRDDKIKIGIAKLIEFMKAENVLPSYEKLSEVSGLPTSTLYEYRKLVVKEKEK